MPEVPPGAPDMSRKRGAEPGPLSEHVAEKKKACWGILTSQANIYQLERARDRSELPNHLNGCPPLEQPSLLRLAEGSWADRSPLHEAASQGRLLALRTLLAQGYYANIVTIDHVSPLHEACLSGHVACVRALINAGANVNATTIDGVTPLYNCCASGSVACLELLLQHGANTHTPQKHFPSALHEACKRGNSQCVESLLSHGVDPDYEVPHLGSALYVSSLHRQTACSKILLHRGASVNVGRGSDSPLHEAARQDSSDQVMVLLDYGADVNLRDGNNQRPVQLAPSGGKTQQLLMTFEGAPRSLRQTCRLQIRNVIGRSRLKLLPVLPLPPLLTHYLEHI